MVRRKQGAVGNVFKKRFQVVEKVGSANDYRKGPLKILGASCMRRTFIVRPT